MLVWHYTAADTWESPLENLHSLILINLSGHNCGLSGIIKTRLLIRANPPYRKPVNMRYKCTGSRWLSFPSEWVDVYDRNAGHFTAEFTQRRRSHTLLVIQYVPCVYLNDVWPTKPPSAMGQHQGSARLNNMAYWCCHKYRVSNLHEMLCQNIFMIFMV